MIISPTDLSHHRPYRSVGAPRGAFYGGFYSLVSIPADSHHAKPTPSSSLQKFVGKRRLQDLAVGYAPVALPSVRPHVGGFVRAPERSQRPISRPYSFPCLPQQLSNPASEPLVQRPRPLFVLRQLEVLTPTSKLLVKRLFHDFDTHLSVSRKNFPERVF